MERFITKPILEDLKQKMVFIGGLRQLRDLERINEIQNISLLLDLLKTRVGSLIVVSNLASDLQVVPNTVKR